MNEKYVQEITLLTGEVSCLWSFCFIYIYIYVCCRSKERIKMYSRIGRSMKRFVFFKFIYFVLTYVLYMYMFPASCFHQRTYVAQGLVNGVLNETWRSFSLFPIECLLYSALSLFDVVWGFTNSFTNSYFSSLCECVSHKKSPSHALTHTQRRKITVWNPKPLTHTLINISNIKEEKNRPK